MASGVSIRPASALDAKSLTRFLTHACLRVLSTPRQAPRLKPLAMSRASSSAATYARRFSSSTNAKTARLLATRVAVREASVVEDLPEERATQQHRRRAGGRRRPFSASALRQREHHFDTLKFIRHLQSEGFSEVQAISLMRVLGDVISEAVQNLTRTMVPREDALKTSYTQKIDFNALRTELLQNESSEAALTKTTHDRLTNEIARLQQRLRDEVARTQASVRLDLNLEKGRIREESSQQELRIKETETRIEQEVAALRERVEGVKFDTVRWLAGVTTGTAALLLGAWRLFM